MGLVDAGFDLREVEAIRRVLGARQRGSASSAGPNSDSGGGHAERAAQHLAAAVAPQDDVADRVSTRRAERHIVMGLVGLGPVAEVVGFRHMRGSFFRAESGSELRAAP